MRSYSSLWFWGVGVGVFGCWLLYDIWNGSVADVIASVAGIAVTGFMSLAYWYSIKAQLRPDREDNPCD